MAGRLLVVNDQPGTGEALQGALVLEGFHVDLATDAAGALDLVEGEEPDAVIVDVASPDSRGAALCRRLRQARPRLPVLMLGTRGAERPTSTTPCSRRSSRPTASPTGTRWRS